MKYWDSLIILLLICFGLIVYAEAGADTSAAPAADSQQHLFYAEDIKLAVSAHIADQLDEAGIFCGIDEL